MKKLFSVLRSTTIAVFWLLVVIDVIEIDFGATVMLGVATLLDFFQSLSE